MGFGNLPLIVRKLTDNGMTPARPIAVISKAATREQRTVTGTLADIEQRAQGLPTLDVVSEHLTFNLRRRPLISSCSR